MRVAVQHVSRYVYPEPASLGPQVVRLRPAAHARAVVESYALRVDPPCTIRWQQDPSGNRLASLVYAPDERVEHLEIDVELVLDVRPINPFDFLLDDAATRMPFAYADAVRREVAPFLELDVPDLERGERFREFSATLPREGRTVDVALGLCAEVARRVRYVIREEPGVFTPEHCLREGRGSCRDSAVLLVALLRERGLAARFVSGYLVQLADEGMIPDLPRGLDRDVVDLHAWAEVYLPGAGWIGLDATSGLAAGEGHVPLACTGVPSLAAPIEGTCDVAAAEVRFSMRVERLGHDPRPTAPYPEHDWQALLAAGDRVDAALAAVGVTLTSGGEPTFNARDGVEAPEWNGAALGPAKRALGERLAVEIGSRLAPGGVRLARQGKAYPGEPAPRWAIDAIASRSGEPLFRELQGLRHSDALCDAARMMREIERRLGLGENAMPAFQAPWRVFADESALPPDVEAEAALASDSDERRRLARLLSRGAGAEVAWVLPLARLEGEFVSDAWSFRRGRLFLLPGDAPVGLRLPLASLGGTPLEPREEPEQGPRDPRRPPRPQLSTSVRAGSLAGGSLRTALVVEPREGELRVFLPPFDRADDFVALVRAIDEARDATGLDVALEGYPPVADPGLARVSVTPDPGVLEVNVPPSRSCREHVELLETVFDAALRAGLHSEKYLLDGRLAGSGGGHHLTLGGPSALESPFVTRPDVLASLLAFVQHHPSLSYLFAGLFVGPTSQAPRVDEARHESLYELEIALARAHRREVDPPPWLADLLFRHLLVDLTGNTHRAEICIDKLFDPATPHGRQGLVELRAFEMPPHPRLAGAQAILARALVAAFATRPYRGRLARFGQTLHDKFLLPRFLWADFEDVLAELADRGVALPAEGYRPFLELRCPVVGRVARGGVLVEVRNAIEPWNVLGEEVSAGGTARYVDSSMERIEIRAEGLVADRHAVYVNGHAVPMRATGVADEAVVGVRFRAWAPPHALHPHLGIHGPLRIDLVDTWARRSIAACAYHVVHPEGRAFEAPPLTRFEAAARRAQRFTLEGPLPSPVELRTLSVHADAPYTIDLRRFALDRPPPKHTEPEDIE